MKSSISPKIHATDRRAAKVIKAMRDARRQAVKAARMHGVPVIYLRDGKIVREHP